MTPKKLLPESSTVPLTLKESRAECGDGQQRHFLSGIVLTLLTLPLPAGYSIARLQGMFSWTNIISKIHEMRHSSSRVLFAERIRRQQTPCITRDCPAHFSHISTTIAEHIPTPLRIPSVPLRGEHSPQHAPTVKTPPLNFFIQNPLLPRAPHHSRFQVEERTVHTLGLESFGVEG